MTRAPSEPNLATLAMIRPPLKARRAAWLLFAVLLALPAVLGAVPWVQFVPASGRVIAFDPTLREQEVEAPVDGRVLAVHVVEGQRVTRPQADSDGNPVPGTGTLLVTLQDPDPRYLARLKEQRTALAQRLDAARQRVESLAGQITSLTASQKQALAAAEKRLEMARKREQAARQSLDSATAARTLARQVFDLQRSLLAERLASKLDYQQATQKRDAAEADWTRLDALLQAAADEVAAFAADLDKVRHDFDASIRSAVAARQSAEADAAAAEVALTDLDVRIARQDTQQVFAPCDGTVFRVDAVGGQGGMLVKAGQALMRVVPDIPDDNDRVVELFVDGNDAPLIMELWKQRQRAAGLGPGEKPTVQVRLQFEGYPAVQTVGWPSLAVGTFGGVVDVIDPAGGGKGDFRILVRPDPAEEATNPWPSGQTLRQGLRATGWVLLNQVPLGWEMWRRVNGFPPVTADKDDAGKKKKPALLKGVK